MPYYVSSGVTSNGIVLNNDYMYVSSGGTVKNTTVDFFGSMYVLNGGTANNTTVNSFGSMNVYNGMANSTTVNEEGKLFVSSGTANSITVNYLGSFFVYSGGTANSTTVNTGGNLRVSSGGTAKNTTVNEGYFCVQSGGTANKTTVNSFGGYMIVDDGGTANSTTVNSGVDLIVCSGGTATTIVENGGRVHVATGANAVFASNTISGLVLSYGTATVHSGTTAIRTSLDSSGCFYVFSGGTANSTTVKSWGAMFVSSGGTATDIVWTPCEGHVDISDGAVATFVSKYSGVYYGSDNRLLSHAVVSMDGKTINSSGEMNVMSGGTANSTTVNASGSMFVYSGGTAGDTTVNWDGMLIVSSGGKVTGWTPIGALATVSAYSGAILDFDISNLAPGALARISDFSRVFGWNNAIFTLTVGGSQENGTYSLTENASRFNKTISVVNTSGTTLGSLAVGQTATLGGADYTLNLNGGKLTVTVVSNGMPEPEPEPIVPQPVIHEKLPSFTGDFIGNGKSMLAVKNENVVRIYRNNGTVWSELSLANGWDIAGIGDFDGDGADDILRVNAEGYVVGEMSQGDGTFAAQVLNLKSAGWSILGTGDFNHNGTDDVLIANPTGASDTVGLLGYWESGVTWTLINGYSAEWECVATGDFDGDGKCDMLWRNSFVGDGGLTYNAYCTWIVEDPVDWRMVSVANPREWNFLCSGDFDGNGSHDIAMINGEGVVGIWGISDGYLNSWSILSAVDPSVWALAGVADFNGDGTDDIAWSNTDSGLTGYWQINNKELTTWANLASL